MSSIIDKINESLFTAELARRKENLKAKSVMIIRIDPSSAEYDDICWLIDNRIKILRNRKLIDLIS
jgi:hypothetical protein